MRSLHPFELRTSIPRHRMRRTRSSRPFRAWRTTATALLAMMLTGVLAPESASAQPASAVQPFSGRYEGRQKVAFLTATALASIELRRSSRFILYTMRTTVSVAFVERRFQECSVIRIEGERLLPMEYVHRDESSPEHNVHTRFDWVAGLAKTTLGGKPGPRVVSLDGPAWDPMSYQVALIALASGHQPGDRDRFRVIERGVLKEHEATFEGPVAATGESPPQYGIASRKSKGLIALRLLPGESWRPARVTLDEVTITLMPTPVPAPTALPEGGVPSCENGRAS
jgi:hypothetical protein